MLGKTISHYKIIGKLGEGGMGVVYKAEDTRLMRTVALKFLPPHLTRDEEAKTRFITEAQAASALDHQNICTIFDIKETDDGQLYIVMAYYDGETLREKVLSGQFSVSSVVEIAGQIAAGLARAHEAGITHRDIKPSNIMITERGEVKILDFGIARIAGQKAIIPQRRDSTLGTVAYMSPEQVKGETVDHRTDIWALGVVQYEMLTGQQPFEGEYDQAVMYRIVNEEPEPVFPNKSGRKDTPGKLDRIVHNCLEKIPAERYQKATDILADLGIFRGESEIDSTKIPSTARRRKIARRRFKRIALTVGMALILMPGFMLLKPFIFKETPFSEPMSIAVISFENMTGDSTYDYLQKVIPNLFITSLEQSPYLRVATLERLRDLSKQTGRKDVDIIDKELGFELCQLAGINTIVVGSFARAGDVFVTDVKLLDIESKSILKSASARGEGVGSILATQIDEISKEISRDMGTAQSEIAETQRPVAVVTTTSLEAYDNFILGRDAFRKSYHSDVIRYMDQAVALDSTFAIAHLYLSFYQNLPRAARHRQFAKRFSHKATRKDQLYIEARLADSREKRLSMMEEYVRKYPKEKRAHLELGGLYLGRDRHKESLEETQKTLELDPEYGLALNQLGYTYAAMGHFEKAIQTMKKYISVDPGNANAYDSLAEIYLKMGMMDEAIENFKQALAFKPDFWADWRIAYCYALKEDYEQALKWNMSMIKKVRARGGSLFGLTALYHYFSGSGKQAFRDLANWEGTRVESMKFWIYYDQGNLESAQTANRIYSEMHIEIGPPNSWYKVYSNACLGFISVKDGKPDSAAYYLNNLASLLRESSLERAAEYKNFYYHLLYGELLLSQDSLAKAITVAKRISVPKIPKLETVNIIPYNFPFVVDVLARAYEKNGDFDKAIAEYERLTKFDPLSKNRRLINPIYHYRLAKVYEQAGQPDKAIERYEKLLDIWKNADADLPDLIDAKARYARLKGE